LIFICYAILITYTNLSDKNINFITTSTTILAITLAGFDTAKSCENSGWLWGILSGIIYALILIGLGSCVSQKILFSTQTLMLLLLSIASGGVGGIIGINFKKA
jgi:putative membrane protein (TIGR04086 family)